VQTLTAVGFDIMGLAPSDKLHVHIISKALLLTINEQSSKMYQLGQYHQAVSMAEGFLIKNMEKQQGWQLASRQSYCQHGEGCLHRQCNQG